jgi:hypothetical protein
LDVCFFKKKEKFMRIVTRPDFDGVVCAVLLSDVETITAPILWVEPSEIQRNQVEIQKGDILANLPYDDRCSVWFDHHCTNQISQPFKGAFKIAPSAAGVIWEYYQERFHKNFTDLVRETDKIDSANLTLDEVNHPENNPYVLLSMTILNREKSDEAYWNRLVFLLGKYSIDQVLSDPDVKNRCDAVIQRNKCYKGLLQTYTHISGNVAITDFRPLGTAPVGNRFLVYSLFPEAVAHVKIRYTDNTHETIALSVGHSIFNHNCRVNAGKLLSQFEGGGHAGAASCRFHVSKATNYIPKILDILIKNESID